jgi:hypothetical protein
MLLMKATRDGSGVVSTLKVMFAAGFAICVASGAQATTVYNANLAAPGVYYGSGNINGNWTASTENNVELGLRTIHRGVAPVAPTSTNIYNVPTGFSTAPRAWWNFDYSVNLRADGTGTLTLADVIPNITVLNTTNGQLLNFNPFVTTPDNAIFGNYAFQNSENLTFSFVALLNGAFGFDVNQNNTFIITLSLLGPEGARLGSVNETVIVGDGAQTPIPAALPLFASGLGVLAFGARRKKRKAAGSAA